MSEGRIDCARYCKNLMTRRHKQLRVGTMAASAPWAPENWVFHRPWMPAGKLPSAATIATNRVAPHHFLCAPSGHFRGFKNTLRRIVCVEFVVLLALLDDWRR